MSSLTRLPRPARAAFCFAAGFVVLAVLVLTGTTAPFDWWATRQLRPGDAWGPAQIRYSPWMTDLAPPRMYGLLAVTSLSVAIRRRSWRPALVGLVVAGTSVTLTVLTKLAFHRPDPHGHLAATGGSFPSGHTIAVVACLGGCLLVALPRVRWWHWTPVVAATALMTVGLLVSAAHWATDVLGGGLLALTVVAACSGLPLRRPASPQPGPPASRPGSRVTAPDPDLLRGRAARLRALASSRRRR